MQASLRPSSPACASAQLAVRTATQGSGQAGYTAVSLFNRGRRPCSLQGYPRLLFYRAARLLDLHPHYVNTVLTAESSLGPVTLAAHRRGPLKRAPTNAFFLLESANVCSTYRVRVRPEPREAAIDVTSIHGGCVLPRDAPFETVSQYQPDPG